MQEALSYQCFELSKVQYTKQSFYITPHYTNLDIPQSNCGSDYFLQVYFTIGHFLLIPL